MNARISVTSAVAEPLLEGTPQTGFHGAFNPREATLGQAQSLSKCEGAASDARHWVLTRGRPYFMDKEARAEARLRGEAYGWLRLIARHGTRFIEHVGGDYALAVIDLHTATLTLFTDRFAQHPIFYREEAGGLRFSSRAADLGQGISNQAIFNYFHGHVIGAPDSVYDNVRALPAGSRLEFSSQGITLNRYWQPAFEPLHRVSTPSLAKRFRQLLRAAVERSMEGTHTGCFLSGGTDSSTLAGMLSRITGARVKTYSIGFDVEGYDELDFAQTAAAHFDCAHHAHTMRAAELLDLMPQLARAMDQPFGNSSLAPTTQCATLARQHGTTHLLAGDGGDELFGGNTRYAQTLREEKRASLARLAQPSLAGLAQRIPTAWSSRALRAVTRLAAPLPDRLWRHNLLTQIGVPEIFTPEFLSDTDTDYPHQRLAAVWAANQHGALIDTLLAYDWQITLADNDLPKVCLAGELADVAVRFPMLDERVVDFSLSLAPALKVRGMSLRRFFKYALTGFLPQKILRKKKHGFGLPFGPWLLSNPALHDFAKAALHSLGQRGVVQPRFINELLTTRLSEHPGYYGELVWLGVMLEMWLQAHQPAWQAGAR
ncbi:MAG: hypothetical protein RIR70_1657 [Pseudomonadota bacterium]|jgi:asparagine synthase (glutamine-hydrolysing)